MRLSRIGLALAGLYAVLWALAWGCASYCAQDPHHGNTALWLVPLLPTYEALRLTGTENTFAEVFRKGGEPFAYLVMLITLFVFYAAGWLIGAIAVGLYRTGRYLVRLGAPQPGA